MHLRVWIKGVGTRRLLHGSCVWIFAATSEFCDRFSDVHGTGIDRLLRELVPGLVHPSMSSKVRQTLLEGYDRQPFDRCPRVFLR